MKFVFLCLMISVASANMFELPDSSVRFKLSITPKLLSYKSEMIQKDFALNPCQQKLASELNDLLLSNLPEKEALSGLAFRIDGQKMIFDQQSKFSQMALKMDTIVTAHFMRQSKLCP